MQKENEASPWRRPESGQLQAGDSKRCWASGSELGPLGAEARKALEKYHDLFWYMLTLNLLS